MRWFLTDFVPGLGDALRVAGEDVVDDPERHVTAFLPHWTTGSSYPLRRHVDELRPEVAVLVAPFRRLEGGRIFGYHRQHAIQLRSMRVRTVFLVLDDPATWDAYAGGARTCTARPNDVAVYVTGDAAVYERAKKGRRCVLWRPGDDVGPIVTAVRA